MRLEFTVPGKPVPKGRPRVVRRGGKTVTFTPERTTQYERHVGWCAVRALRQWQLEPEGWRAMANGKEIAWPEWASFAVALRVYGARANADLDNVSKAILDGCEGRGLLWTNDRQVKRLSVERCDGKPARVEVTVEVIAP